MMGPLTEQLGCNESSGMDAETGVALVSAWAPKERVPRH